MHQADSIQIVQCHACGEVGDVIVEGVAPPPGETLWEQSRWIARDQTLRNFVLNEPRGGVHKHVNLLVRRNPSMSPFITASTLEVSCPVRTSLTIL